MLINNQIKEYIDVSGLKCNGYELLKTDNIEKFNMLIEAGCDPLVLGDRGYELLKTNNIDIFNRLIELGCEWDDKLIDRKGNYSKLWSAKCHT